MQEKTRVLLASAGLCLLILGCARNDSTHPELLDASQPPAKICDAVLGERMEVLFTLMPKRVQKVTSLKNLSLEMDLPQGRYLDSCKLLSLEDAYTVERWEKQKGKDVKIKKPRVKATYLFKGNDGGYSRSSLYFIRENGSWYLLPTYDLK